MMNISDIAETIEVMVRGGDTLAAACNRISLYVSAEDLAEAVKAYRAASERPAYSAESFRGLDRRLTGLGAPASAGPRVERPAHTPGPLSKHHEPGDSPEVWRVRDARGMAVAHFLGRRRKGESAANADLFIAAEGVRRERDELAEEVGRLNTRQEAHVRIINAIAERLGLPEGSSDEDAEDAIRSLRAEVDMLTTALKQIRSLGGNLSDERLTGRTGANDAVARGLMYTEARCIAEAALLPLRRWGWGGAGNHRCLDQRKDGW